MMRVILNILSGAEAGRRILLDPNQLLRVGRTSWANIAVPDSQMSRVHFELRTDGVACYVRDADSRNGTLVNGQPVTEAVLRNHDEIVAGETRFSVHIEGDRPEQAAPIASAPPTGAQRIGDDRSVSFVVTSTESGLQRFSGRVDELAPAQLASLLASQIPLMLIVDFHRIEISSPSETQSRYLYNGLDPVVQQRMSPVLIEAAGCDVWPSLVEAGWGRNAVTCCYTRKPFDAFAAMVREIGRGGAGRGDGAKPAVTESIVGIGWPAILGAILNSRATQMLKPWFAVVDVVLLEDPEDVGTWSLFGPAELGQVLEKAGLTDVTPQEEE